MKAKSFFTGFFTGTAILGTLTLLVTPASGKEVQATCRRNWNIVKRELSQFSQDSKALNKQLKATIDISKDTLKVTGEEMKESVLQFREDIEPALTQLQQDVEALQKNVESSLKK